MASLATDPLEALKQTKKFVKTVDQLQESDPGYALATKIERRDSARQVEREIQELWKTEGTFTADAGERKKDGGKFMCTFPYPYMNGRLHLGHAFSLTKADFAAGYHRLKGRAVLFPFSFHCTGMPIQAAANKLTREIETYGLDSCMAGNFEMAELEAQAKAKAAAEAAANDDGETKIPTTKSFKGSKTKAVAKDGADKGRKKTQWEILQMCDVPDNEIESFTNAQHWLRYFPPHCMDDLKLFGLHADWRRSFITTDTNPYYDSFIRWQFSKLKESKKIAFGKRPTVYSRLDGQACMDHDRSSGEGKGHQEYTLIKLILHDDGREALGQRSPAMATVDATAPIVFVAATLRPETMYGQTNCFILPEGEYGAYRMGSGEIFIMSSHAADNLCHQAQANMTAVWGQNDLICTLSGMDVMGLPLVAPNATYDKVYTLPLLTISMTKGTGVVTSVPSDAPDDYAALTDLQTDEALRTKYGIELHMVESYKPVPIIRIPGGDPDLGVEDFGEMAAVTACLKLKVKNQHDSGKLKKIKKSVYNKGYYAGVMTVGSQLGKTVEDAKDAVKAELIASGDACRYWEPEEEIRSRSGDKCIIAFIDQWYLKYGTPEWRDPVMAHVQEKTNPETGDDESTFKAYGVRIEYENTLNWLGNWACSRSFGLGTRVPWDEQFVVESLSDSTIYMSYYTVSHLLQGEGNVDGSGVGPLGIQASELTGQVWDYIFKKGAYPSNCTIPEEKLMKCRTEFEFWYPMDLRVSGKDLVRNHLTMCLYNHAAIWPDQPEKWPRSFFTNGHVMVDNQKMSKSSGNFISLSNAIQGNNVHLTVPILEKKIKEKYVDSKGKEKTRKVVVKEKNWKEASWKSQSWTADTVRFALAEAGDTMNDANFQTDIANSMIKQLDDHKIWVTSMLTGVGPVKEDGTIEPMEPLREGEMTIQDKAMHLRLDECILAADTMYEEMKFSQVVKWVWHVVRQYLQKYRNYSSKCGMTMHKQTVERVIRSQIIMLSPIVTHWCENLWRNVLKESGSVTKADWPALSDLNTKDSVVMLQANYLDDMIENIRDIRMKAAKKKKRGKKGKKGAPATGGAGETKEGPPTKGVVYVQTTFPKWRETILTFLQTKWDGVARK
jgi:leucyl-tRNA synthetase